MSTSSNTAKYFQSLKEESLRINNIATSARKKGLDPEEYVEIKLAETLAERVIGLISAVAPQITNTKAIQRIQELEEKYEALDWRVAFEIALEIAQGKHANFKNQKEAIEIGVRTGFAYVTLGVVSAPLEGLTSIDIKDRLDGKGKYFCLNYAGPVRAAGGTSAAVSVLIADYVRKNMGYEEYDPTEKEIQRCYAELEDYHEYVANLQYFPSKEETEFLMKHIPVEISGDPSEKYEVSSALLKDLPRIPTNNLRSGYSLIHSSCIPLKAPKLWAKLSKWGKEMNMEHWSFLEEFLKVQSQAKMKTKQKKDEGKEYKITPDYTYIKDLVGGRPVLGHPLRSGAFRLRYGRSRTSGFSAQAIHPASMHVLNKFIAIGTQLKVERPGKAAAYSSCDTIEGPIIKLKSGDVILIESEAEAKQHKEDIEEILYAGDVLINYGDFYDRNHKLIPPGYCQEIWIQELEEAAGKIYWTIDPEKISELVRIDPDKIWSLIKNPLKIKTSFAAAKQISKTLGIPLHPSHTYHWKSISVEEVKALRNWVLTMKKEEKKIVIFNKPEKRLLELIGLPHKLVNKEYVVIEKDHAEALIFSLGIERKEDINIDGCKDALDAINNLAGIRIKDKSGIFIGSRMGRPEKAKMRKLTGSPHVLFPVGEQGGRLRSFQAAISDGKIIADMQIFKCTNCDKETPFKVCDECNSKTQLLKQCEQCGQTTECPHEAKNYKHATISIEKIVGNLKKRLGLKIIPDLIKGVRGTSNKNHVSEHLMKGILRAKHDLSVNKDGTVRYDCSELTLTHFKPKEIGASVSKLKELGYKKDIYGAPLEKEDQVLELKVQDVVLPCCPVSPDEPADEVLFRTANFVDEELEKIYGLKPFYNLSSKEDLIGHLTIGLAPHTSAGIITRIIGFSKTQGFFAHPYVHAAMRRDCFSYNTYFPFLEKGVWRIRKIGELVEEIKPEKIVDAYGTKEAKVERYKTISLGKGLKPFKINNFTKHEKAPLLEVRTALGKKIKTTKNHKFFVSGKLKEANALKIGDLLTTPYKINIEEQDLKEINLLEHLKADGFMVRNAKKIFLELPQKGREKILLDSKISKKAFYNYHNRGSYPASLVFRLPQKLKEKAFSNGLIAAKRDTVAIPAKVKLEKDLLELIGLYVAEGYARSISGKKGLNQVYISAGSQEIRSFIRKTVKKHFNLKPSENKRDRVTFSSKALYLFFTKILGAGSAAREKRIPPILLSLPKKKLSHLLRGYFEGDGSAESNRKKISCDTVSEGLLHDLEFCLARYGIFAKRYEYEKEPGPPLKKFYESKKRKIPLFKITKLILTGEFADKYRKEIGFLSKKKKSTIKNHLHIKNRKTKVVYDSEFVYDPVVSIEEAGEETTYCLNVATKNHLVIGNSVITRQCDGDESCLLLLMDAFLNFSKSYLPSSRGSTMDAPLVLTSKIIPSEVDDMVFNLDIAWKYPLKFYRAAEQYKSPGDIKIKRIVHVMGTERQYEGIGFTHDTTDLNAGVLCSAYKLLPSMSDKVNSQMDIAVKLRAVDATDVAKLVINKHFIRDTKGNLRKFSLQQFRCVNCNEKYRRPPLAGNCVKCRGKIIFTISEGSIIKYMPYMLELSQKYSIDEYTKQVIELTQKRIEGVFGKEKEIQKDLESWFGSAKA